MADNSEKTEKPTQRRQEKAREDGQYPSARQFLNGVQFCVFVALLQNQGHRWFETMALAARRLFRRASSMTVTPPELLSLMVDFIYSCFVPLLIAGAILVGVTLALQLAITRMGFTFKKLTPDFSRLSPLSHLRQLPRQNLPALFQAVILLPVFGSAIYAVASEQLSSFVVLPLQSVTSGSSQVAFRLQGLLWKAAALFFVFGCVDLFREIRRNSSEIRMSKKEIRDEAKDSEGNSQVKAQIRNIRRSQARRRMMKEIPTATALVVNPTHFAVAIRYVPETMAAPIVVAKGKNYLALRIRKKAAEYNIPLVENPPLAQALYKSVDVGQEIPPHLYRIVAELLAYIFQFMKKK